MTAFETWWDEQNKRETKGPVSTTSVAPTGTALQQPAQQQTQPNEQQAPATTKKIGIGFEGLNFGFGLGLGLRAAMPKLPSFRVSRVQIQFYQSSFNVNFLCDSVRYDHLLHHPWMMILVEDCTILMKILEM